MIRSGTRGFDSHPSRHLRVAFLLAATRVLLSTGFLFALLMSCLVQARCRLGFERRVDAAIYRSALEDQNAHAVIGTRCCRNGSTC
jgi:hypothetical protein